MHPLDSSRLKVKRADIHINALKKSIGRLFDPQYTIEEKPIMQGKAKLINVEINPSLRAALSTSLEAGTTQKRIPGAIFLPCRIEAAILRSSSRAAVQEARLAWLIGVPITSSMGTPLST